jgi:DNA primase small subunit
VDYVSGTDLDLEWLFRSTPSMLKDFKSHRKVERSYAVPSLSSGGWRRHARTALEQLLNEFEGMDPIEARRRYPGLVKAKEITLFGLQNDLYSPRGSGKRGADLVLENDSLEYISDRNKETFLEWVRSEVIPRTATHVDEPVTRDVKRLIRMPYSLHGKTGMQVVSLTRDQLERFDPLRDAFPAIYPSHIMKVEVKGPLDLKLRGERVHGEGVLDVPTYAAIFLILRMKATLA